MPDAHDHLLLYATNIRRDRRANPGAASEGTGLELLLAPRMQQLLEALIADRHPHGPRVLPEFRRPGIGRPDIAFKRGGEPARAFIELKQPDTDLNPTRLRGHDKDQFQRFKGLPTWGFCNFHAIHLYRRGDIEQQAHILPAAALLPATSDAAAERLIRRHNPAPFLAILETLVLAVPSAPRNPRQIAEALAHAARLTRDIVRDLCRDGAPPELSEVRAEFRETLFAHPIAGGYDTSDENALFANAFAQTLAFGLLLAREATAAPVTRDAYRSLPEGAYPLLRATLRALTQDELLNLLGVAFDVLQDTVNVIDTSLLAPRAGSDPILYFYEDFLDVFDHAARMKNGVFFTPVPVVRFIVGATDRALRTALGTRGLTDPAVLLLDPACGTGTFPIAVAERVADEVRATLGEGALDQERAALAQRLHGLELLVGPYTVAHYRLLRELSPPGKPLSARLPIYLADTLAPPIGARDVVSRLGFMSAPIVAERAAADALKRDRPILAILGNPPYRRLAAGEEEPITTGWATGFWDDLKAPVRNAGWGNELNTFPELSIAFWRWAMWKLFDSDGAPRRGVVCFITNRTFLSGHPYAGLRQMMRRRFDTIDIIDLRGDNRGARPAGILEDENVFAIQVGVCITIATASGYAAAGAEARVRYADAWRAGAFTADAKKNLLTAANADPTAIDYVEIARHDLEDFLPEPFQGRDWPSLDEIFAFRKSGSKSQRDDLVYDLSEAQVIAKIEAFQDAPNHEAWRSFFPSPRGTDIAGATAPSRAMFGRARAATLQRQDIHPYAYRPLDRRYLYQSRDFVSRYGPELIAAWGATNVCLYAMPKGTGAGPAIWTHGLLPDYHAFSGRGGYAFPLWDRRLGTNRHNLNQALLDGLQLAYGSSVAPQLAFDAAIALLSATSYTSRFADDLEKTIARIPFPADQATFAEAARIGAEISALETFARSPAPAFRTARLLGRASGVVLEVPPSGRAFLDAGTGAGFVPLQSDQSLRLAGVSQRVWDFAVSGYPVLYRFLAARNGEALDAALQRAILDIVWRIQELLHWFDAADPILDRALSNPLTRADLLLRAASPTPADDLDSPDDRSA